MFINKVTKHTQTIRRQFANELPECAWPFRGIGTLRVKKESFHSTTTTAMFILTTRHQKKNQGTPFCSLDWERERSCDSGLVKSSSNP